MPFIEDMAAHHLSIMDSLDGRVINYTPDGGSARALSGMFQAFSEVTGGESVDVVVGRPVLSVRTQDIPEIAVGDQFTIDGTDYEVSVINPDSEGVTELFLEEL